MVHNNLALESVDCGICGNKKSHYLFHAKDYIYGNKGAWPVAQCDNCNVVFMNPRISPECISQFYPQNYYTNTNLPLRKRWIWTRAVKDIAIQRYYGYSTKLPNSKISRILGYFLLPFTKRWTGTSKYIYPVEGGKVLDIGCGNGQILSEYKRLGWKTFGIEVGLQSAKLAQQAGHDVFVGELTEAHLVNDSFDAITLWDSLEHIHNPSVVMKEIYRIMKPGGKVYISVPNFGSWYGTFFKDQWFMFTAPIHYYHYTDKTLQLLLNIAGFHNIQISYPLGDAGFAPTINALFQQNRMTLAILQFFPIRISLKLLDFMMPRGHLLAIAEKGVDHADA